jgi:hypothetical protein
VIVLDENIFADQRSELVGRRIHLCQIGHDAGRKGMQDDEILALLPTIRRPTLVTRDKDFFQKRLCSERYCLAFLAVRPTEVARYVQRLFQHFQFKTFRLFRRQRSSVSSEATAPPARPLAAKAAAPLRPLNRLRAWFGREPLVIDEAPAVAR